MAASTERAVPSVNSFMLPNTVTAMLLATPGPWMTSASELVHTDRVERHRRRVASRCPFSPIPVRSSVSRRMPRESPDAPEDLPKQPLRPVQHMI
jgi:hypothetical protein